MADNKDIKTKDPTADDELNSLDFDFAGDNVLDDRSPSTKIRDAVMSSAKTKITDSTTYTKLAKRALPKEYGEAAENIGVLEFEEQIARLRLKGYVEIEKTIYCHVTEGWTDER